MEQLHTHGLPIAGQSVTVTYTGTAGTTATLDKDATSIRVVATTDCFIEIGTNPTAVANTGLYLPALVPEYFTCPMNAKVSAIQVSAGGSIYVTPFADEAR
jgi:hypothetical protein